MQHEASQKPHPSNPDSGEALRAARDILPLAIGVAVYGAAFGLLTAQAGMDGLEVGVMGLTVFAGSSQIVAVERLVAGAGASLAIIAGLALNLRLLLLTASVREIYAGRPWWQVILGAHLTSDENWALMLSRRAAGEIVGFWYMVGSGVLICTVWIAATVAGNIFATAIPEPRALGMDFAFTAAFIAIACTMWRGWSDALPWSLAILVATGVGLTSIVDTSFGIVAGGVGGAVLAGALGHD